MECFHIRHPLDKEACLCGRVPTRVLALSIDAAVVSVFRHKLGCCGNCWEAAGKLFSAAALLDADTSAPSAETAEERLQRFIAAEDANPGAYTTGGKKRA